jgi:hypothetical protein
MNTVRKTTTSYWKPFPPVGTQNSLPRIPHPFPTRGASTPTPAAAFPRPLDNPHRDMDEHWTAVTAYLAGMDCPNEG